MVFVFEVCMAAWFKIDEEQPANEIKAAVVRHALINFMVCIFLPAKA